MSEPAQNLDSGKPTKTKGRRKNAAQMAQELAYKTLRKQGITQREAAKTLGLHPGSGCRIEARIKDEDQINGLLSPELDGLSVEVLHNFLKQGSKMKKIRGSDALGAVKVYSDRRWPTKNDQPPTSISFTEINICEVRIDPSNPQSIDITPDNGPGTCG